MLFYVKYFSDEIPTSIYHTNRISLLFQYQSDVPLTAFFFFSSSHLLTPLTNVHVLVPFQFLFQFHSIKFRFFLKHNIGLSLDFKHNIGLSLDFKHNIRLSLDFKYNIALSLGLS